MTRHERIAAVVEATLRSELPGFTGLQGNRSWEALGLDSFGLIALRAAIEQALGHELEDSDWVAAATPDDLIALGRTGPQAATAEAPSVRLADRVDLGMPQMAMSGLSEFWLLRTLGDLHWRMIAQSLDVAPAAIVDDRGERLYPTFTRVRFVSTEPLAAYGEGETLRFDAGLSRLGVRLYFSTVRVEAGAGRSIAAELMSAFVHRGPSGGNSDLVRARPAAAADDAVERGEMPAFGLAYQERRRDSVAPWPVLARQPYEIVPHHDINGAGLLYCAAYPSIADISQMRARGEGPRWAAAASTIERDTCFFANADLADRLEWRLHRDAGGDGLDTEASIVRGDGVVMASVRTRKAAL